MTEFVGAKSENVQVAVRVRPLNSRELGRQSSSVVSWRTESNTIYPLFKASSPSFSFDHLFTEASTNSDVYEAIAAPIVKSVVDGYSGVIFAYGQTSSGKTHTMMGSDTDLGVTKRSVEEMIKYAMSQQDRKFLFYGTYVEIYNENIRDLLNPEAENLKIREDPITGQVRVDSRRQVVGCLEDVMKMIADGERHRSVGETNMNDRSSRSHTIFTINLVSQKMKRKGADDEGNVVRQSSISLVDLAGSEKASHSGAEGKRLVEGGHINKSLLTLGKVISKLSSGKNGVGNSHIPYRDSKLTRLLQPALGGSARTGIICAITPSALHAEETLSTLKFASGAKKVTNRATCVVLLDETAKLRRAEREIARLKRQLKKNGGGTDFDTASDSLSEGYDLLLDETSEEENADGGSKIVTEGSRVSRSSTIRRSLSLSDCRDIPSEKERFLENLMQENENLKKMLQASEHDLAKERQSATNWKRAKVEAEISGFLGELISDVSHSLHASDHTLEPSPSNVYTSESDQETSATVINHESGVSEVQRIQTEALAIVVQSYTKRLEITTRDLRKAELKNEELRQRLADAIAERDASRALNDLLAEKRRKSELEDGSDSLDSSDTQMLAHESRSGDRALITQREEHSAGDNKIFAIEQLQLELSSVQEHRDRLVEGLNKVRTKLGIFENCVVGEEETMSNGGLDRVFSTVASKVEEFKALHDEKERLSSEVVRLQTEKTEQNVCGLRVHASISPKKYLESSTTIEGIQEGSESPRDDPQDLYVQLVAEQEAKNAMQLELAAAVEKREGLEKMAKVGEQHLQSLTAQRDSLEVEVGDLHTKTAALEKFTSELEHRAHENDVIMERLRDMLNKSDKQVHLYQKENDVLVQEMDKIRKELNEHMHLAEESSQAIREKKETEIKLEEVALLLSAEQEKNFDLCERIDALTFQDTENAANTARQKAELVDEVSTLKKKCSKTVESLEQLKMRYDADCIVFQEVQAEKEKLKKLLAKHLREGEMSVREKVKLLQTINTRDQTVFQLREKLEDYRRGKGAIRRLEREVVKRDRQLVELKRRLECEEALLVSEGLGQQCLDIEKVVRVEAERDNIHSDFVQVTKKLEHMEREREAMKLENVNLRETIKQKDILRLKMAADNKKLQVLQYDSSTKSAQELKNALCPVTSSCQDQKENMMELIGIGRQDKENIAYQN